MSCMRSLQLFLLIIWMFIIDSEEKMNITKYQNHFAKKCLGLYKKETQVFEFLPKAIDFAHLLLNQNIPELAMESISKYLECGVSKKYALIIYGTTKDFDDRISKIAFKTFQITKIQEKNWSILFTDISSNSSASIQKYAHKIIKNEYFKHFLKYFFMVFKVTKMLMKYQSVTLQKYSYVSIDDITDGVSRQIPDLYKNIPINLGFDTFNLLCVKIFSENVNSETTIDREKMVNEFNRLFDESKSKILIGCYTYFLIDKKCSEIHETATDINKLSYKTIINIYQIVFDDLQILENGENNLSLSKRPFCFKIFSNNFEFEYFYTSKHTKDSEYKFFILFRRDSRIFEFNYKWLMNLVYNDKIVKSSFSIAVFIENKLNLIEFMEDKNWRFFKIHRIKCLNFKVRIFNDEKIYYYGAVISINAFLDNLIFYPKF